MKNRIGFVRRSFLIIIVSVLLLSCTRNDGTEAIRFNHIYKGKGMLYFRVPVSGSSHQMIFMPFNKSIDSLSEIDSTNHATGVMLQVNDKKLLSKIYDGKKQVYPLNYSKELDPGQRVLNYLNVYIEMKVGPRRFGLLMDTILLSKKEVFKYVVPETIVVDSLKIVE